MRLLFVLGLVLATAAGAAGPTGIDGFLAVRGDRVLATENADVRLPPASLVKLLVAVAAMDALGPEHRIETLLSAHGELRDGVLDGDLILHAAGDPSWGPERHPDDPLAPLRALGESLRRQGLRQVDGDLVVDTGRFPGRAVPPIRARGEVAYALGAPAPPLAWDRGLVRIELGAGPRPGTPARLRAPSAPFLPDLDWDLRVTTVGRERHGRGTVDVLPRWGTDAVLLEGEFPISEPVYRIEVAHPRPVEAAAEVVRAALEAAGISVAGTVRLAPGPGTVPVATAVLRSPTLSERLEPILVDSSNWHAEMLVRSLGAEVSGEGRLEAGLAVVLGLLQEQAGLPPQAVELEDGSGISADSLVTARAVVDALRWASTRPWFPEFVELLPGPGEGTLAFWPRLPELAGKSGTGRRTVALAGVLEPGTSPPTLFCAITSGSPRSRAEQRRHITARLAELARRVPATPSAPSAGP